jgi:hypothetical protein
MRNIEDMTADEIAGYLASKALQPGGCAPRTPEPVQLGDELAKQGADLQRLISGVDVVVGVLNGTVQEANRQFWGSVMAAHQIDTERFLWSFEAGCLTPTPKGEPTPVAPAGQPAA